jgi:hypothetical protein
MWKPAAILIGFSVGNHDKHVFFPLKKCMHKCCMQKKKKKEALAWQAFKTMKGAAEEGFDASERTGRARERACITIPGKYIPPDSFCLSLNTSLLQN